MSNWSSSSSLHSLPPQMLRRLLDLEAIQREEKRRAQTKIASYFPDLGPLRRELYPKHLEFFAAGAEYNERLFMAANRVGKSDAGAYETTLHLTGDYPAWWVGKRFNKAIKAWACSDTNKTSREVVQEKLLGPLSAVGTGFIPATALVHRTSKAGVAEAVETIYVRHVTGGTSSVQIKSYQEGRESFQGAAIDFAWLDETPGISIYSEVLLRLLTTSGSLAVTMTPILGLDELTLSFLPEGLPSS